MYAEKAISGYSTRQAVTPLVGHSTAPFSAMAASATGALDCLFYAPDALPKEIMAQWDVLADHASEPNVFAERWFMEPSLRILAETDDVRVAVILSSDGILVGLVPLTVKPEYGRIRVRNVQNWQHHNSFLGTPLVHKGLECAFWETLLSALNDRSWASGVFHVSGLSENGPVLAGLRAASPRCDIVHTMERAVLRSALDPETYWTETVRKKKRKELNRLANRLTDLGDVTYATLPPDEEVAPWIEAFLTLEGKGWKGEAGSALHCDPQIAEFVRTSLTSAHDAGKLDFHRLDLNGEPIAMLVNFLSAPGGFSFKIAFDEDYAKYSPGVLLERYNLRILERADITWMDSCASEDHPMINSLWTNRRSVVRVTVPLDGLRNRAIFHACRMAENAMAKLKTIRGKFRG